MTFPKFARSWIMAQSLGYLILALAVVFGYSSLSARSNAESRVREQGFIILLERMEGLQAQNLQITKGLTDYVECVTLRANDRPQPAPISTCAIYLSGGGDIGSG